MRAQQPHAQQALCQEEVQSLRGYFSFFAEYGGSDWARLVRNVGCVKQRGGGVQSLHKRVLKNYINFCGFVFGKGMGGVVSEIVFERADYYYCRNAGLLILSGGSTTRRVSALPIPSPL